MKIQKVTNNILEFWAKTMLSTLYPKECGISTHLTFYERWKLKDLAFRCRGRVFVEIGSYLGASACFISAGIRQSRSRGKLYSVDSWQNEMMSEERRDTFEDFLENTAFYSDIIVPLRGQSCKVSQGFTQSIDFLFLDGDHSLGGIQSDVEVWFPKLNEGALVIFHDIGWAEGVQQVVEANVRPKAIREGRLPNLFWAWL